MQRIILLTLCIVSLKVQAQQDAEYRNFLVNPFYYNAAYAGDNNKPTMTSGARLGSGTPGFNATSILFQYESPIQDQPAGIGFLLNYDRDVTFNLRSVKAGLAANYKNEIAENSYFRIGAQVNGYYLKDVSPATIDGDTTSIAFDIDFGALFRQEGLFIALSSKNLARTKMNLSSDQLAQLSRHLYISVGYKFEGEVINVTPSLMMRKTNNFQERFDIHTQIEFYDKFVLGMTLQASRLALNFPYALMAGYKVNSNLRLDGAAHLNRFNVGPFLNPIFEFSLRFSFTDEAMENNGF